MVFKDQVDHFLKVVDLSGISPNFREVYPKKYYQKKKGEREREREREKKKKKKKKLGDIWRLV